MKPGPASMPTHRARGFTLIEVLVALSIMAVLATMAWQGVDAMARTREATTASVNKTLRVHAAVAQWERDLQSVQDIRAVPALNFDGATVRMTRTAEGGMQVVAWTLRQGAWWRWAGPAVTRVNELQEQWMQSLQLLGNEPGTLRVLPDVREWTVYYYRGNGWTNPQSDGSMGGQGAAGILHEGVPLPGGVRLVLGLPEGALTRDLVMPASS